MMKSIFLSESKLLDMDTNTINDNDSNEYIMVETRSTLNEEGDCYDDEDDHSSTFCDDDDYDYCDDVLSEGIQSGSLHINLTEDMILEEASEQPSIQHILDEAHRSASELGVSMDEDNDNDNSQDNTLPEVLEKSASNASVVSDDEAEEVREEKDCPSMEICPATEETAHPVVAEDEEEIEPRSTKATQKLSNVEALMDTTKKTSSVPDPIPEQKPHVGGRMSNKKRRKKMKLMKKAAAAAKAAATLTEPNKDKDVTPSSKASSSHKVSAPATTTRYNKKRVANIAVACATETLASYKAELAHKKLQ